MNFSLGPESGARPDPGEEALPPTSLLLGPRASENSRSQVRQVPALLPAHLLGPSLAVQGPTATAPGSSSGPCTLCPEMKGHDLTGLPSHGAHTLMPMDQSQQGGKPGARPNLPRKLPPHTPLHGSCSRNFSDSGPHRAGGRIRQHPWEGLPRGHCVCKAAGRWGGRSTQHTPPGSRPCPHHPAGVWSMNLWQDKTQPALPNL